MKYLAVWPVCLACFWYYVTVISLMSTRSLCAYLYVCVVVPWYKPVLKSNTITLRGGIWHQRTAAH